MWIGNIDHVFRNKFSNKIFAIAIRNCYQTFVHEYYIYKPGCAFFINQVNVTIPGSLGGREQCGYAHTISDEYIFICGGFTDEAYTRIPQKRNFSATYYDDENYDDQDYDGQFTSNSFTIHDDENYDDQDIDFTGETSKNTEWIGLKHSDIYVFDVKKMKIFECNIEMPKFMAGPCHAICIRNDKNDELAVNGFIRKLYTQRSFIKTKYPALCIIQIILQKYNNEYLHVIQINNKTQTDGKHCKININNIINAIKLY